MLRVRELSPRMSQCQRDDRRRRAFGCAVGVFIFAQGHYPCPQDGTIRTEAIAWIEIGARVTKAFAQQVNRLTAITTNEEAGWYLGLNDEKVYRIDKPRLCIRNG
jgi:hypothetical protein